MNIKRLRLTPTQKEVVARMLDGARIEYSEWVGKGVLVHKGINDAYAAQHPQSYHGGKGIWGSYPYRLRFPSTVVSGLIRRGLVEELDGEIKHASIYLLKPDVIPYLTPDEVGEAKGVGSAHDKFPYTTPNGVEIERRFNEHIRGL